jgi:type II secretory pathway predicted ATPase ExeA/LysM repeat protein
VYCDFYRLRERPFNVTADPKFLYLNACYREALASLHYGITQRKGFIALIGEAGTGKTTLLKKLMDDLDENTRTVFIFNTNVSFDEMLEYIFHEFELPVHNGKRLYMLQRLNKFLLDELREGRNVALLIDEAQDLEFSVMEDLRLLSNLETAKEKILQIVLSGQPELGQKLGSPNLRQLRQRVAINCRLQPLSPDEVSEYIQARLMAAGCADPKLFSRDAEGKIYEISRGIPRVVNVVCDNALVIGYALGKKRLGGDVITEAAADLFSTGQLPDGEAESAVKAPAATPRGRAWDFFRKRWMASPVALAIVAMAVLTGLVGRSLLGRESVSTAPSVSRRPLDVVAPAKRLDAEQPSRVAEGQPSHMERRSQDAHRPDKIAVPPAVEAPRQAEPETARALAQDTAVTYSGAEVSPAKVAVQPLPEKPAIHPGAEKGTPPSASGPVVSHPMLKQGDERVGQPDVKVRESSGAADEPRLQGAPVPAERVEMAAHSVEPAPSNVQPQSNGAARDQAPKAPVPRPDESVQLAALPRYEQPKVPAVASMGQRELVLPEVEPASDKKSGESPSEFSVAMPLGESVTVRAGDSISAIAIRKYGQASYTTLDLLKLANPTLDNIDVISVGQKIEVPVLVEGLPLLREGDGKYALLLQSSPQQRHVNALGVVLSKKGFHAEVRRTNFGTGRTVYRLLVPGIQDRESARQMGDRLKRLFREDEEVAAAAW